MKAWWLDSHESISLDVLASENVIVETIDPQDPDSLRHLRRTYRRSLAETMRIEPETPGLRSILRKLRRHHVHRTDEVQWILAGSAVFDIRSKAGQWMRIRLGAGDLVIVPAERLHRFLHSHQRRLTILRLS